LGDAKHEGIDIGHPNYGSDDIEAGSAEMVGRPGAVFESSDVERSVWIVTEV
jgi:hypothetical protein